MSKEEKSLEGKLKKKASSLNRPSTAQMSEKPDADDELNVRGARMRQLMKVEKER